MNVITIVSLQGYLYENPSGITPETLNDSHFPIVAICMDGIERVIHTSKKMTEVKQITGINVPWDI